MSWEDRFSSVVRETESNINRIKSRLGSARFQSQSALTMGDSAFKPYSNSFSAVGVTPFTSSPNFSAFKPTPTAIVPSGFGAVNGTEPPMTAQQTQYGLSSVDNGLLMALSDRIDCQNQEIENLQRSLRRVENERDQNSREMDMLRDEMRSINRRLTERGVDMETDKKLDRWKRETDTELNRLQTQLTRYRHLEDEKYTSENQFSSMTREIQDMKRYAKEECDGLRRELETMKSRLVRVELELASIATDNKDLSRRNERIEKSIREITFPGSGNSPSKSPLSGSTKGTMQVHELQNSMKIIQDKIMSLETSIDKSIPTNLANSKKVEPFSRLNDDKATTNGGHETRKVARDTNDTLMYGNLFDEDISLSASLADYDSEDFSISPKKTPLLTGLDEDVLSLDLSDTESVASEIFLGHSTAR
ncbi:uncharacterized protein LOC141899741 isoform X2 [Tubulanus polymorphus]|uniref:uncharacterized protein LOC141899741 isoform X2 n=1 Tax=Tubulanus polymorphus TaxID=672921 RepID=UPI003DA5A827